jgi:hypothetical protein
MKNLIKNSNADEMTELNEYKRIYSFIKWFGPVLLILNITPMLNPLMAEAVEIADYAPMIIILFSFSGYCLALYLFKLANLVRYLIGSFVMIFFSFMLGTISSLIIEDFKNVYLFLIIFSLITFLLGGLFGAFIITRGIYAFMNTKSNK